MLCVWWHGEQLWKKQEIAWHDEEDGWKCLCCCCKANLVVAHIINRVVGPEEDITKDPQRLSILGWQVSGHDANTAIAIVVLKRKKAQSLTSKSSSK